MHIYVFVCVIYVCMYVIYVSLYVCMFVCHVCVYVTYVSMYLCMYAIYVVRNVMYACMHVSIYVCVYRKARAWARGRQSYWYVRVFRLIYVRIRLDVRWSYDNDLYDMACSASIVEKCMLQCDVASSPIPSNMSSTSIRCMRRCAQHVWFFAFRDFQYIRRHIYNNRVRS